MKIAYAGGMSVDGEEFRKSVTELIQNTKPSKIIETGTYLGTGTTKIIAEALNGQSYQMLTIESNPHSCLQARANLTQYPNIRVLEGLSIPRRLLPSIDEIEKMLASLEKEDIFVDFQEHERLACYARECSFDVPEDLLGICSRYFGHETDLFMLDSSGHLGFVEFAYILSFQRKPCYFILDDVYHVKHHKSLELMKNDSRFFISKVSPEKFGFCIAKYKP